MPSGRSDFYEQFKEGIVMSAECCATNGNVMILACSGGSNVGQLANQAAVELTKEGFGKMFCLCGVGGHLSGFVRSARDVPEMVAVDGCDIGCARAILEHAEVPSKRYLVVTELGIEKNKEPAKRFSVRAIPTQIFFDKKGKEVHRHEGFMSETDIDRVFKQMGVS
jgi:uncharacterized metal-binding protein